MSLPPVRALRIADCAVLASLFPEDDARLHFADAYIEQLQDKCRVFVAAERDDDGQHIYYGHVQLLWTSPHTYFWQRNIPELVSVSVHPDYRRQGIGMALVDAVENVVRERGGHTRLGVHLDPRAGAEARAWLAALHFTPCAENEAFWCRQIEA